MKISTVWYTGTVQKINNIHSVRGWRTDLIIILLLCRLIISVFGNHSIIRFLVEKIIRSSSKEDFEVILALRKSTVYVRNEESRLIK
jgi:hypothetical protein